MGSLSVSTNALVSPLATQRNKEKPVDLNVRNVVLGDILFKTWYPSFYPEDLIGRELERLFVCQWCFKYSKDLMPYLAHTVRPPQNIGEHCADRYDMLETLSVEGSSPWKNDIFTKFTRYLRGGRRGTPGRFVRFSPLQDFTLTVSSEAFRPKSIPFREALPR